ncbi:MAG: transketolase [Clostridia bacterium]|nr:transketolase [Clostridia bacterium]
MTLNAGKEGGHIGPGLSVADIVATLFFGVMRIDPQNPDWPDRDRFILSKGHAVLGYYPALAQAGYFPEQMLETFEKKGSPLAGHPCTIGTPGVDFSSGSMGHGLSVGLGMALAAKLDARDYSVYVVLGDGEQNEGAVWEAAMAAAQYHVDNLIAVIDRNGLQHDSSCAEVMDTEPLADKWRSFGWETREVDGHDIGQLLEAFQPEYRPKGKPYVIIAHTTKGKGVSFMENGVSWHHAVLTQKQAELALAEISQDKTGGE